MARWRILGALAVAGIAATMVITACGGDGDDDDDGGGGGGNVYNVDDWDNFGSGGTADIPSECLTPADDTGCVGQAYEGENTPLDIFVMFDISCSMSCSVEESGCCDQYNAPPDSRIVPVREAMESFLRDPASAGISVGLGFFGDHDANLSDQERNSDELCSVENHSDATVPIAPLPGNADAMVAGLNSIQPQGGTPTQWAIRGACQHVIDWKAANPGRKTVVLLVTDGIPEHSCSATFQSATAAAEDCYDGGNGPEVYVLGVDSNNNGIGDSRVQLDGIAEAGGTDQAYLTDASDTAGSMLDALNAIRADAVIPCDMRIPPPPAGEELNPNLINLGICDSTLTPIVAPRVDDEAACGDHDGWYYDDPDSPERIHLCDVTCNTVSVPGSTLFFSVGCQTYVEIQ
jgi:hypothetical protein